MRPNLNSLAAMRNPAQELPRPVRDHLSVGREGSTCAARTSSGLPLVLWAGHMLGWRCGGPPEDEA